VSVGTGTSAGANYSLKPEEMHLLFNATSIPSALMYAALNEQARAQDFAPNNHRLAYLSGATRARHRTFDRRRPIGHL
jgi:hypothetical protein